MGIVFPEEGGGFTWSRRFGHPTLGFVAGGLSWRVSPAVPFHVAALVGLGGVVAFVITVDE